MKKLLLLLKKLLSLFLILLFPFLLQAKFPKKESANQTINNQLIVNGYDRDLHGEIIDYQSCHPDANSALLVRCSNAKYIEWETAAVGKTDDPFVTFAWIAGYASGSSGRNHQYQLWVNDKPYFVFHSYKNGSGKDWDVAGPLGSKLNFRYVKSDHSNDLHGYVFLSIRKSELNAEKRLKLKVIGDDTDSKDWYMTFRYEYSNKVTIVPQEVVLKGEQGRQFQQVKVVLDHFLAPAPYSLSCEGKVLARGTLNFGSNDVYLSFDRAFSPQHKRLNVTINGRTASYSFELNPVRDYTIYLLPHSHVDIGYTELQSRVMELQCKNIDRALDLAEKTANYPIDARFRWNCEGLWAIEGYLQKADKETKKRFFNAIKRGQIGIGGLYCNELLGLCRPEELFHIFDYSNQLQREANIKIESAMISDVPGYSWGIVPAMAYNGIKYFSIGPNTFDRIGNTLSTWGDKPFYWKSPSGREKVLVWVSSLGYSTFHGGTLSQTQAAPLLSLVKKLSGENYPYNLVMVRYTVGGDNGYPDSELSDFVKNWNEKYSSPKLKIALADSMFKDMETLYGASIPTYSGDFTPYWEDGAGSSAFETAENRQTAERLSQAEILWSLTHPENFPYSSFYDAWKHVLLYSEHTWGAYNSISEPEAPFVKNQWAVKKSYAERADSLSKLLLINATTGTYYSGEKTIGINVLNTLSWNRTDLVSFPSEMFPDKKIESLIDTKGNRISFQKLNSGMCVFVARNVPALSNSVFKFSKLGMEKQGMLICAPENNTLENDFYKIEINPTTGNISQLIRKSDGQNIADEKGLNAYVYTGENGSNPQNDTDVTIRKGEEGPVVCSLIIESKAPGCRKLIREVRLIAGIDRVDVVNTVDKEKIIKKENVRFIFPFNVLNPEDRMDMSWAIIRPEKDQIEGANKNYFTIQRWIDVSNNLKGATLFTPDAPLMEIGAMSGENWMKEIKQDWATQISPSSCLYSWVMNNSWHTNYRAYQDGPVIFRYSIKGHDAFDAKDVARSGVAVSNPLLIIPAEMQVLPPFILDENSSVYVTSIRPVENGIGWIVRLYNPTSVPTHTTIHFKNVNHKVFLLNNEKDAGIAVNPEIQLDRYGIQTIRIE